MNAKSQYSREQSKIKNHLIPDEKSSKSATGFENNAFEFNDLNENEIKKSEKSESKTNLKNDQLLNKEKAKKDHDGVSFISLFKYSDKFDKLILIIGALLSILSGGTYPILFWLFGRVAGILLDTQKYEILNQFNLTNQSSIIGNNISQNNYSNLNNSCYKLSDADTNFSGRLSDSINIYVIFGFLSIFLNYVSHLSFNLAAERQTKRIR
jgi:hypothetical protein